MDSPFILWVAATILAEGRLQIDAASEDGRGADAACETEVEEMVDSRTSSSIAGSVSGCAAAQSFCFISISTHS